MVMLVLGYKVQWWQSAVSGTRHSANRERQALKMAAMTLFRSDSELGALYRRLRAHTNKPMADTAAAHKLALLVFFMVTRGEAFVDQGQKLYKEQQRQCSIAFLKLPSSILGFQVRTLAEGCMTSTVLSSDS